MGQDKEDKGRGREGREEEGRKGRGREERGGEGLSLMDPTKFGRKLTPMPSTKLGPYPTF